MDQPSAKGFDIPVRGVVKGEPRAEAAEVDGGFLSLDLLFPEMSSVTALRLSGEPMVGANIRDGDYVLLMEQLVPDVALV